ncbi:hypothetical protein GZL_06279 [Streptomyces sp. 769]|nr:hypothetical protein GZL_06279 [Streptomyces sp. 769]
MIYGSMPTWPEVPQSVADCHRCLTLYRQRADAIRRGDRSAESDCNVLLRRHYTEAHG